MIVQSGFVCKVEYYQLANYCVCHYNLYFNSSSLQLYKISQCLLNKLYKVYNLAWEFVHDTMDEQVKESIFNLQAAY